MRNQSHFAGGFGRRGGGVFTCSDCGKRTRHTGENDGTELCPLCNAKALNGNSLSDAGWTGGEGIPDAWTVFAGCATPAACDELLTVKLAELAAWRAEAKRAADAKSN